MSGTDLPYAASASINFARLVRGSVNFRHANARNQRPLRQASAFLRILEFDFNLYALGPSCQLFRHAIEPARVNFPPLSLSRLRVPITRCRQPLARYRLLAPYAVDQYLTLRSTRVGTSQSSRGRSVPDTA
eukprot:2490514-Rhodomonas_salina.5